MNDLISITQSQLDGQEVRTVNARELHTFLEVQSAFKDWIARRVSDYAFEEGRDFCSFLSESSGGRPAKEYAISLDMAKELAMVERNEKGKQARQYFIECERRAKNPILAMSRLELMQLATQIESERLALESKVESLAPKAAALDQISAGTDTLTFTQASKVLSLKRDTMTTRLRAEGWIYRQNGSWLAYDAYIRNGCLVYKEANYTDETTGMACRKPYCHITPKGLTRLAQMFNSVGAAA
ncbi:MAG: antA/AntB antirepressor family protein [Polycyclovorans sp.]|nr:antA/AntB antirepressor family protein [Polycyclovorans sp.]